jgi:hypothetical protein
MALQMPSTNTAGYTKRVTSTAFVFLAYCIGNIIGPHAFLAEEAPIYQTGCKLILACALCQIACTVALRVLLVSRNRRRDKMGLPAGEQQDEVMEDLTDFEVCICSCIRCSLLIVVESAISICFVRASLGCRLFTSTDGYTAIFFSCDHHDSDSAVVCRSDQSCSLA